MKRWLLLALLCALAPLGVSAQVTISGNLKDAGVVNITSSNTFVRFTLTNYGGNIPRVAGVNVIVAVGSKDFHPDLSGNISGTMQGNDTITPSGTFYQVCIFYQGQQFRCGTYLLVGSTFNLNSATPLASTPVAGPNQLITQSVSCPVAIAATTWTCVHNFADLNVQVQAFDSNNRQVFPDTLTITDLNTVTLTWVAPQTGKVVIVHAGSVSIATTQPNAIISNPVSPQSIAGQAITLATTTPFTTNGTGTHNGAESFTSTLTVSGAITCTNINTIRCISPTNPQGWAGSDLGAWINAAFANCGASACEVDVADGTYTVSTQVAPTTANLLLKFGAVTVTWNAALNLSAANGFHVRGIGSGFLQSSGYPDTGAKATKFINGMSNSDLIFATPGTNVVLGGIIIEDVALIGNGASATSGSNIHFNAIQGVSNIASVRDFSIQRVYSINAKGNGLQMTGAVFCPGNSCVKDSQINFNQGSNILVEPGTSTVFASQIRLTNVDTEGSVTGWGREYEPPFTDVYDNNGTVQGNLLGGALCNGGQCRFLNYHSEGQAVVDIKFLNTAVGGSVISSSLGGNSGSPTGKGIWITGNSAGLVIANNTYSGHAALSDIFMDANVSFTHILDPPTTYSLTDSGQPFNLYFPNGLTKFGFIRFPVTLANGANQNIAAGTANFIRITGPSGAFSLGGFTGGADGKILRVMNDTTQVMTINNQDGGSAAANRILTGTGGNVVLAAGNQFCDFAYETLNSLWRLAGCNIGDQPVGATMTQALTNKTLNVPLNNGTGVQLFNTTTTCTTAASAGATCTTAAITLPVAEADTSYRIVCTGKGATNVPVVIAATNSSATQFTITIAALTAAAATFSSYDCLAGHN